MRRRKYFDWEQAFHFIWQSADRDGIWHDGAASLGAAFDVSEDDAQAGLDELLDRRLIERLYNGAYAISKWRDRGDPPDR